MAKRKLIEGQVVGDVPPASDHADYWVDKIVGHDRVAPESLLANPFNYRLHPDLQKRALAGAIREVGFIRSVTVNKRNGHVVDGHLRVTLAIQRKVALIWVEYVDLTDEEEKKALLLFDPIARMADESKEQLELLLADVKTNDPAITQMLADLADRSGLEYGGGKSVVDADPQINRADELQQKWQVAPGDIWLIGDHRLGCGDSSDPAIRDRVMSGAVADLIFTDPPYGVAYQNDMDAREAVVRHRRRDGATVANDAQTIPALTEFLTASFAAFPLKPGGSFYICAPPGDRYIAFLTALQGGRPHDEAGFGMGETVDGIRTAGLPLSARNDYLWLAERRWALLRRRPDADISLERRPPSDVRRTSDDEAGRPPDPGDAEQLADWRGRI